jgi:ABC-2 type transport system ATP-binding protein
VAETTSLPVRGDENGRPAVEPVVCVRDLRKRYGSVEAVRGIDLEVRRGEIFAFMGPNGAGKTTTVEILAGFRERTAGEVTVLGVDPAEATASSRDQVGVVLQESAPEPGLTVRECLEMYAGYFSAPLAIDDTLALVRLGEHAGALCEHLSGGQRRRLDVALALIGDPELLFLDEPTTGFDPGARRAAWDVIRSLRALGKTIFLTTHYMEEAERLADRIAVIAGGRIAAEGTPQSLGGRDRLKTTIRFTLPAEIELGELPGSLLVLARAGDDRVIEVQTDRPLEHVHTLAGWALEQGVDLLDLDVHRPSLEDVYLDLTDDREEAR